MNICIHVLGFPFKVSLYFTAPKAAITTGQGYTVVPPVTNKTTESVPRVQPEGKTGIIAVIVAVCVALVFIIVAAVSNFTLSLCSTSDII